MSEWGIASALNVCLSTRAEFAPKVKRLLKETKWGGGGQSDVLNLENGDSNAFFRSWRWSRLCGSDSSEKLSRPITENVYFCQQHHKCPLCRQVPSCSSFHIPWTMLAEEGDVRLSFCSVLNIIVRFVCLCFFFFETSVQFDSQTRHCANPSGYESNWKLKIKKYLSSWYPKKIQNIPSPFFVSWWNHLVACVFPYDTHLPAAHLMNWGISLFFTFPLVPQLQICG